MCRKRHFPEDIFVIDTFTVAVPGTTGKMSPFSDFVSIRQLCDVEERNEPKLIIAPGTKGPKAQFCDRL